MKVVVNLDMQNWHTEIRIKSKIFEKNFADHTDYPYHLSHQLKFNNWKGESLENFLFLSECCFTNDWTASNQWIRNCTKTVHWACNVSLWYSLKHGWFLYIYFNVKRKNCPVLPFRFLVHNKSYQEDHLQFMEAICLSSPYLASKKVMIVADREFIFLSVFPLAQQTFCWNHLERDLLYYLKQKPNCNDGEIHYFSKS